MSRKLQFGLLAVVVGLLVAAPAQAASDAPPTQPLPTIEVQLSLTDMPAPVVNLTVPERDMPPITFPDFPAPVVNVDVPLPEGLAQPPTIVVEPAPVPEPEVIYQDREVEVERIVEVPACLDYTQLPYFDLANALTVAFPGEPWSLSGSHYPGLVWHGEGPQPDMTAIIAGWLQHLENDC